VQQTEEESRNVCVALLGICENKLEESENESPRIEVFINHRLWLSDLSTV